MNVSKDSLLGLASSSVVIGWDKKK